ncbi:hypothetical protein RI543_001396 [Arxiozyma heterogenica]|uniref:Uncharacterized protein n=1 Tax=Arxiozyma heterogenica TaxID=278026 RepID=A0AAN7WP04_9SACH|nr:hypothetical protein RI543_001396 [Kazachstania heterogenica]
MEWIDDIKLLENMTSNNNAKDKDKDKELEVPIFEPNKVEWDNFDTYLNKISKFSYLVGICKILPYDTGHKNNATQYNDATTTTTTTATNNRQKYNGEHFIVELKNNNSTHNNSVHLLNTHSYNDNDFKQIKYKTNLEHLNNNTFNEGTIWDNLLNYSAYYTLFDINLKHDNNNNDYNNNDNNNIQTPKEKQLYNFILSNRNISLLQDDSKIKFVESSVGLIKNWEILESSTFKIYYLHDNNKMKKSEHYNNKNNYNNNKSIKDNKNNIRIWYSIIEDDICKFYKILRENLDLKLKISSAQKNLNQKIIDYDDFIIHPKWLIDHDIRFTKTIQYSNEMIVLFPYSCTFALDLTNDNRISEIQFNFKVNHNRPTILQNCLCIDNNNNRNEKIKDNPTNIMNCTTIPTMIALNSSTNIPRSTLEHSLSTNEFNESISRISSPLFSRLLNTGNTTTTTLSSGGTNYDDSLNINEKGNHGDTFLLPSIESVANINDRLHYDNQTNLDINYDKNKVGPYLTNSSSSDIINDDLQQKHIFKNKFIPASNVMMNVNSSTQISKTMTFPSHVPLPPLLTPQLENYKLVTTNPATLTSSTNQMLSNNNNNNNSSDSNNNTIANTSNIINNSKCNTTNFNYTGYYPNPEQICLNTSTTRNDMIRRIASPSFLPLNISRGITESPLSLSMTVPLSNENFGRYNINVGYGTVNKPSKLMNSSLMVNNEPNYFTHNGNITNPYSLLENGSFHNDSMDLIENDLEINDRTNKKEKLGKGVSKKKEKRYTTLDYNNLLYSRFQEQEKFNQDNTVSNAAPTKEERHFNVEQHQQIINNSQGTFTSHQSQTRFLPSEVLITDSGKVYVCCDCKRQFSSGHHLTRHKKSVHSGEKPHSCPKCGKKFKRRDHVLQHLNKKIPCK